jgi:hypothetical protein
MTDCAGALMTLSQLDLELPAHDVKELVFGLVDVVGGPLLGAIVDPNRPIKLRKGGAQRTMSQA